MAANLARALPLQRLCRRHDLKSKTVGQPEQMLGGTSVLYTVVAKVVEVAPRIFVTSTCLSCFSWID